MKKYNIDPFMEKVLSDEYYKLRSSRDFYTGTSFKMSTWDLNTRYFNDENIIDFVSYEGVLIVFLILAYTNWMLIKKVLP